MENSDAVCKFFVDSGLNLPSIKPNTAHVDFSDKNLDKCRFFKLNGLPAVSQQLIPKKFVDDAIDEITLMRPYGNSDFDKTPLSNISDIILHFDPTMYKHAARRNCDDNAVDESTFVRNKIKLCFLKTTL